MAERRCEARFRTRFEAVLHPRFIFLFASGLRQPWQFSEEAARWSRGRAARRLGPEIPGHALRLPCTTGSIGVTQRVPNSLVRRSSEQSPEIQIGRPRHWRAPCQILSRAYTRFRSAAGFGNRARFSNTVPHRSHLSPRSVQLRKPEGIHGCVSFAIMSTRVAT